MTERPCQQRQVALYPSGERDVEYGESHERRAPSIRGNTQSLAHGKR